METMEHIDTEAPVDSRKDAEAYFAATAKDVKKKVKFTDPQGFMGTAENIEDAANQVSESEKELIN